MGDLTENLSRHEFACQCGCGFEAADFELVSVLQKAADYFGKIYNRRLVVIITSGCRCEEHNENIGGHKRSKHTKGIAADFFIKGVPMQELYEWLEILAGDRWGLGLYSGWVHLDMRAKKARWVKK